MLIRIRDPHGANRFFGCASSRTCNTAGSNADVRVEFLSYPCRHFLDGPFTDGAILPKRFRAYTEFHGLDRGSIGHNTSLKVSGRARDAGDKVRQVTAGATLCG